MTKDEAFEKMKRYCSYQDRCHQEVRTKLLSLKIFGDRLEEIISELINEGYLNEERFAINYARGKYRIKRWGKIKIRQALKARNISEYCIRKAMDEVDKEGGYEKTLKYLLQKYLEQRRDKMTSLQLRKKTYAYGISKGFESTLVNSIVASLF